MAAPPTCRSEQFSTTPPSDLVSRPREPFPGAAFLLVQTSDFHVLPWLSTAPPQTRGGARVPRSPPRQRQTSPNQRSHQTLNHGQIRSAPFLRTLRSSHLRSQEPKIRRDRRACR